MVAAVSSSGLGLFGSSRDVLGGAGMRGDAALGRGTDRIYVNTATGNLIVQSQDERLSALGLGLSLVRTYNSQGLLNDDNGDNFRLGVHSRLYEFNAGASVRKEFGDGRVVLYQYNAARALYVSTEGGGAHDTLSFNASNSQWTWTDGSSRTREIYDSTGRLFEARDADDNTLTYGYTGALLTSITDASGQTTTLVYSGNNLTEIKVVSDGRTQTLTRYTYDTNNRLSTVQVDLTPEDTSDARVYKTTYTYDGTSRRIASITQDDGSSVSFTYQNVNGQFRVATYTVTNAGGNRKSTFTYTDLKTEVKDALGLITTYTYDSAGQLTSVLSPTVGGARRETRYGYDAQGNVTLITEDPAGLNRQTTLAYDAEGNLLSTRDSLGNSSARTYNANNQLLTETQYVVRDPDGAGSGAPGTPLTTHYVYDSENHLRFVISPDGRALEHRYNAAGQRITSLRYAGALYAGSSFDESDLTTWASAQDSTRLERVAYVYDFRGNLTSTTTGTSVTRFVYDQRGQLLQSIDARGEATTDANDYRTVFTYDGLGRMLSQTEWVSATSTRTTLMSYGDAERKITTTLANGLITTSVYSQAGELLSVSNGTSGSLGTTTYKYDLGGRLLMVTDPTGVRAFNLYNEAGDKVATVDGDGTLSEFVYNRAGEVVKTIEYATLLSSTKLATLVDASGNPVNVALATLRPVDSVQDRITRTVYDASGARVFDIDGAGAVTAYRYDGAGRLVESFQYYNRISIDRTVDEVLPSAVTVTADANDRRTRSFYNNDSQLIGTLDAAGYLSEYVYGASGHLTQEIRYAKQTGAAVRATGTLAELKSSAGTDADHDRITRYFYDDQGRQEGILDAEGYFTVTVFDAAGNVADRTRFDQVLSWSAAATVSSLRAQVATTSVRERTAYTYDGSGEVLTEVFSRGTASAAASVTTAYTYDDIGNVLSITRAVGAPSSRTTASRYDLLGRITQELTAEGRALITATMTQAQIDDIWARYGITYAYDQAGHRISATVRPNDTETNTTLYYYDDDGRLRFQINPLGERIEFRYNALGQVTDELHYTNRVPTTGLTGGLLTSALITTLTGDTSTNDARTVYTYTLTGRVASMRVLKNATAVEDGLTSYNYNAFGENEVKIESIDATRTLRHEYKYDQRGLLTLTRWDSSGLNTTEARTYDAFGRVLTVTDARLNVVKRYEYDRLGREIASTDASTTDRTVTTYDAFSRVLTVRDALNNPTTYRYDDANRKMTVRTPEGIEVVTTFSVHDEQLTVTAAGNTTTYTYDSNGRLKTVSDSLGSLESRTYDRSGRQITQSNARGIVTTFSYDAANRVLTRTEDTGSGGLALVTSYIYDGQGHVTRVQDPSRRITETTYDAAGRVIQVAVDPAGLNLRTSYEYDRQDQVITVTEGVGSAQPRRTQYVYDTLGRRIEETVDPDGLNLRTQFKYDANGNLTRRIDAAGYSTWYIYDTDNRLTNTVDALGGVTRQTYDAEDRITSTRRFANTVLTATFGDVVSSITISTSANDRLTQNVYDNDGRERFTIDSLGGVIERSFDANGNVILERRYAIPIAAGTYATPSAVLTALTNAGNNTGTVSASDRVTWQAYDVRGQLAFSVDGAGAVTQYGYDASGNVISQTAFATLRSTTLAMDLPSLQSWATSNASHAQNRTTRYWFDGLDRMRFTLDAEGYLSEVRYNDAARTQVDVTYASKPTIAAGATLAQVVTAAANASGVSDQLTTTLYDIAGRVSRVTDVIGNYDEYTYDAVGNRISFRNKKGSVWNYEYDADRRLTREIAPAVAVTTVTENGTALTSSTDASVRIETVMTYNALGDVLTRTEAANTSQARTTSYVYDALGRQIRTVFPIVSIYPPTRDPGVGTAASVNQPSDPPPPQLYTETAYDALGNAFRNRDVAGNYSYKVYDQLGRVKYEVDVGRYVTAYTYDTFSNQLTLTRHASALASALPTTGSSIVASDVTSRLTVSSTTDRTITTTYDRLNRAIQVTQPAVHNYLTTAGTSGGTVLTAGATVVNEYNAFGQVVRMRELIAAATYADTYFYYDRRGLKNAQLDALKYLTLFEYDETGDLIRQVDYSRPVTGAVSTSSYGTIVTTTPSGNPSHAAGYDREVRFAYDRLNRKISETRVGIEYTTITGTTTTSTVADQLTTYGYDALGNLTRVTIGSANTYTYYDVLGRIVAVAEPSRDRGDGTVLTPLTLMRRDALGNLVEQRVLAGGATAANEASFTASSERNTDRLTLMRVDAHGRVVQTYQWLNATQATSRYAGYNARGDLMIETQDVTNGSTVETLVTLYLYDALGRQTSISEFTGTPELMATTRSNYNAFGELISKSVDGLAGTETYEYDQVGRLWRTNSEDGVYKVYLYDLQGNATATLTSRYNPNGSVDLSAPANAAAVNALAGTLRMETVYDVASRVIEQREPTFTVPTPQQEFNAAIFVQNGYFYIGNFAETPQLRLFIDGVERQVEIVMPNEWDEWGWWVGVYLPGLGITSGNHDFQLTYWRPGAPAPYISTSGTIDATGSTYSSRLPPTMQAAPKQTQTLDRWGNVLATTRVVQDLQWNGVVQVQNNTWTYRYNQFGQLLEITEPATVWVSVNSQTGATLTGTTGAVSRNYYDLLGRLIATRDGNGNLNQKSYNQAGQVTVERSADNQQVTRVYDVFGQEIQITDQSGFRTRQLFDRAGRLLATASEINSGAFGTTDVTSVPDFSASNNGKLVKQYTYDEAGRRLSETTGEVMDDGVTPETRRYTYDLRGNVIAQRGPLGATMRFQYDARGNKTLQQDEKNAQATWSYNLFGKLLSHVDFGGTTYTYTYDAGTGLLKSQTTNGVGPNAGQNRTYEYDAANHLNRINDYAADRTTLYFYDSAGRVVHEYTRTSNAIHEDTHTSYDAAGRISRVYGHGFDVTYSYDLADNRTRINATYASANFTTLNRQDLWYRYDAMNRVTISKGTHDGTAVRVGSGTELTYNARGMRASATTAGQLRTYTYDGLGRLDQTMSQGRLEDDRDYDRASRVTRQLVGAFEGGNFVTRITTSSYNDAGLLLQRTTQKNGVNESKQEFGPNSYDAAGNVLSYVTTVYQGNGTPWYTSTHTYTYRLSEGYQEATHSVVNSGVVQNGSTAYAYNANGEMIRFTDSNSPSTNRYFANNAQGNPLTVVRGNYGTDPSSAFFWATAEGANYTPFNAGYFYYSAEGQQVGMSGWLDSNTNMTANFDVNYTPISPTYPASVPSTYVVQQGDTLRIVAARLFGDANLWYLLAQANGLSEPDAVIPDGRILEVPNEVISLSNSANVFKPFDIKNAIGDTTPTQPAVPAPEKKKGCGVLGMILVIAVAVVATIFITGAAASLFNVQTGVTATGIAGVFEAGAAVLGGAGGALGVAAAAIGGAVGSIASQGVAIAAGLQEGLDFKGVALGAIGAGVGAAAGGIPGLGAISDANKYLGAAANAAAGAAITQGIAVATGLQAAFNWKSVATAALSAPLVSYVGAKAGRFVGGSNYQPNSPRPSLGKFASDVAGTVVSAGVRAAIGGKFDVLQVTTDAFGNAIGNAINGRMQWVNRQPLGVVDEEDLLHEAVDVADPEPSVTQRPVELPALPSLDVPLIVPSAVPIIPEWTPIGVDDVPPPPPPPVTRALGQDETLWSISRRDLRSQGLRPTRAQVQERTLQYMQLNGITDPLTLQIGQTLRVPTGDEIVSAGYRQAYEKSDAAVRAYWAAQAAAAAAAAAAPAGTVAPPTSFAAADFWKGASEVLKTDGIVSFNEGDVRVLIFSSNSRLVPIVRTGDELFTDTAIRESRTQKLDVVVNAQQYELSTRGYLDVSVGNDPVHPNEITPIGQVVGGGSVLDGRSSPLGFFLSQSIDASGSVSYVSGQGDPSAGSTAGFGGGIPLIVNGLKYGEMNLYTPGTSPTAPATGNPGAFLGNLTQKSNAGYAAFVQNYEVPPGNFSTGKVILAHSRTNDALAVIVQPDGAANGRSLSSIRDNLYRLGFSSALSFDGSTSATLLRSGRVEIQPSANKNSTIETGIGIRRRSR
jgi:YD repeat-containing protein